MLYRNKSKVSTFQQTIVSRIGYPSLEVNRNSMLLKMNYTTLLIILRIEWLEVFRLIEFKFYFQTILKVILEMLRNIQTKIHTYNTFTMKVTWTRLQAENRGFKNNQQNLKNSIKSIQLLVMYSHSRRLLHRQIKYNKKKKRKKKRKKKLSSLSHQYRNLFKLQLVCRSKPRTTKYSFNQSLHKKQQVLKLMHRRILMI